MDVKVRLLEHPLPAEAPVEIVERKGLGHPDTICDALAERLSVRLCRFYLEQIGLIMHHNVDKALLWGGTSRPAFGGGEVTAPIEIFLAGRAVERIGGVTVPVADLVNEVSNDWFARNLRALDPARHLRVHSLVRPGSADLVELYMRQKAAGEWLANDTSCGAGFAPLSPLEATVLGVERHLNTSAFKAEVPAAGEDIKVMGVRVDDGIALTVACAIIDRHTADLNAYLDHKARIAAAARETAAATTDMDVAVDVNTADDTENGEVYLTVTGTSAEAGDDGEAGRGNRHNGLITPYRPMTMESVAGKNPVTHVGKLYNIAASRIAEALVAALPEVGAAQAYLVSQIGRPVTDPRVADICVTTADGALPPALRGKIAVLVGEQVQGLDGLWRDLIDGEAVVI
ncbi:MAG: methionine adenosyltransferase [Alphaproteobacteria bacterium]|nr:methionine adenosyltransferase [Alphaproteobacteria bacterium]